MSTDLHVELADGTRIGYADVGDPDGPPVVYFHGNPGSRLEVDLPASRRAAEQLGFRLLAPDRPGMGLSSFRTFTLRGVPAADWLFCRRFGAGAICCDWVFRGRQIRVCLCLGST